MIKINDILNAETNSVNASLKTHYFKDITTYGVTELVEISEGNTKPCIYTGDGNYQYVQTDTDGLIIYHRILGFDNDEDLDLGFGRNGLTTETYSIKSVFYGQQIAIEKDCEDISYYLAKEFKKLIPRTLDLNDINRISVSGINYDKNSIKEEEGLVVVPSSILFSLDLSIVIKSTENCNL